MNEIANEVAHGSLSLERVTSNAQLLPRRELNRIATELLTLNSKSLTIAYSAQMLNKVFSPQIEGLSRIISSAKASTLYS